MGAVGAVLGGSLLGLGMSSMRDKQPSYSLPTDVHSSMETTRPETPDIPATTPSGDGGGQSNALMEAEREKERQQALLRQQQAREVFTSGLGAGGVADTSKKTLLGG